MSKPEILIVDDEPGIVKILCTALSAAGYITKSAGCGEEALKLIHGQKPDLMIVDLRLGRGMNGIELLQKAQEMTPAVPAIMITAYGTIQTAVEAMKQGAFDFLCKPFDLNELTSLVKSALANGESRGDSGLAGDADVVGVARHCGGLIGESESMRRLYRLIERVAPTDATVMIHGESGTGKELVAQAIHHQGKRAAKPWVALNCAAIPGALLESEMFGHKAGSFTGAGSKDRIGLFATADGGTLFLDEIGVMDYGLQGKLLRTLQEGKVRPVGANQDVDVDVRVVAATNENLEERVQAGEFREDLYYRINVIPIQLPPLREREGDIELLARFFGACQARSLSREVTFAEDALAMMRKYNWPGNVRELQNAVACAATLCENGVIETADLPPRVIAETDDGSGFDREWGDRKDAVADAGECQVSLKEYLRNKEQQYIESVLRKTGGNRARAADLLGISRATFYRKYGGDDTAATTTTTTMANG